MSLMHIEMPWMKQPWEKQAHFELFEKYYLSQKVIPRKLTTAYAAYLIDSGRKTPNKIVVPGNWTRMANAQDNYGVKIEGGITWDERAKAWDKFKEDAKEQEIISFRTEVLDDEIKDYHRELAVWEQLYDALLLRVENEKLRKGDKFNPHPYVHPLSMLVKAREQIAQFGRRTAGLPSVIKEDRIAGSDGGEFTIKWEDPYDGLTEDIGRGQEIINKIIKRDEYK